jgi:hypothetical protein
MVNLSTLFGRDKEKTRPQPLSTEIVAREYARLWLPQNEDDLEPRLEEGRALFADMKRFEWRVYQPLDDFAKECIVPELIKAFVRDYVMPNVIKESLLRTVEENPPGGPLPLKREPDRKRFFDPGPPTAHRA